MLTNHLFSLPLKNFEVEADDLVTISELGRGAYGVVEKVRHAQSSTIMAVKVSRASLPGVALKEAWTELQVDTYLVALSLAVITSVEAELLRPGQAMNPQGSSTSWTR